MTAPLVSLDAIRRAADRVRGVARLTPLVPASTSDEWSHLWVKCENLQAIGAFKVRGAYNFLAALDPEERARGVVTYSSGNHGQAVAFAARRLGTSAVVVMPTTAAPIKVEGARALGAEIHFAGTVSIERQAAAEAIQRERGLTMVPPFDHPHVIAGQGTAAKELVEEVGPLDYLLVPCGGGGLLSGCAVAASYLSPGIKVIGVEPAAGDDVTRSFKSKTLQTVNNPDTIADGARTTSAGEITFPLILRHVQGMLTVTDEELLRTMLYLWERMKIVVEPTGALAAAALLERALVAPGARIGVVISGGNADFRDLAQRNIFAAR